MSEDSVLRNRATSSSSRRQEDTQETSESGSSEGSYNRIELVSRKDSSELEDSEGSDEDIERFQKKYVYDIYFKG